MLEHTPVGPRSVGMSLEGRPLPILPYPQRRLNRSNRCRLIEPCYRNKIRIKLFSLRYPSQEAAISIPLTYRTLGTRSPVYKALG